MDFIWLRMTATGQEIGTYTCNGRTTAGQIRVKQADAARYVFGRGVKETKVCFLLPKDCLEVQF